MNFETIASVWEIKAYNLEAIEVKAQILKVLMDFVGFVGVDLVSFFLCSKLA